MGQSEDLTLPFPRSAVGCPQTQPAEESVLVFAVFNSFRQLIEAVNVAAAEHEIIGNKGFLQLSDGKDDFAFPFFCAKSFDSRNTEKIFNDAASAIRKDDQFASH